MITVTSLQHDTIRCKLHGAMIRAAKDSRNDSLLGYGIADAGNIRVQHFRYRPPCGLSGFRFVHKYGDITETVLKALRS